MTRPMSTAKTMPLTLNDLSCALIRPNRDRTLEQKSNSR